VPEKTKAEIVEKYLKNHQLELIEGIWSYTQNGKYEEIAIIKKSPTINIDCDYVGIKVAGTAEGDIGEAKIILKKTAIPDVYNGTYFYRYRQGIFGSSREYTTTFVVTENKLIQTNVPEATYMWNGQLGGYIGQVSFIRIDDFTIASHNSSGVVTGTGFFVTPSIVITNHHVVEDAKKIEITFQTEYTLPATVVARDASNDIAILSVQGLESKVVPLKLGKTSTVREGERVYTIGFPLAGDLGVRHKIAEGLINGLTGIKDDPTVFQISIPIQPGNSGGPLILNDGRVVGITSSGLNSVYYLRKTGNVPQNVNFAVKSDYIMPLLDIAGIKLERAESQGPVLDPVAIMETGKSAVVFVRVER
jgi:Trypsin-like serine proteases, typically periplasmic, contain C-terminal PDZ domain